MAVFGYLTLLICSCCFTYGKAVEKDVVLDGVLSEMTSLWRTVKSMEETIRHQNVRISELQQNSDKDVKYLKDLILNQNKRIIKLEKQVFLQNEKLNEMKISKTKNCEAMVNLKSGPGNPFGSNNSNTLTVLQNESLTTPTRQKSFQIPNGENLRQARLLVSTPANSQRTTVPPNVVPEGIIAFYAYMSKPEVNPSSDHLLRFDTVITNDGHGYHENTGVFNAPATGTYVFTWTYRHVNAAEHGTELIRNKAVVGSSFLRTETGDDATATETIVIHVTQDDDVYVRTHSTFFFNRGNIESDDKSRSSFAGWKLMN